MISTTKLSARTVLRAVKAAFRLYQSKASQGKQSVRTLLRQNRGVSSVEISKTGIRGLERYAKKYGIDYAIRKDTSEVPPRYLVFFKAPDAEAFNSAFKEYSASLLNKDKRPSVLAKLHELVQAAAELPGKVRHDGFSGVNFNRPGFQSLIKEVEAGNVETLIVKDMSRLGRNYLQVGFYTEVLFPQKNVRFLAINNSIDSNNASDNDFAPFLNMWQMSRRSVSVTVSSS